MTKIILCMIVRNESKIITRCIESVLSLIDAISITDTGSDDNTPQIIEDFCKIKNIKGFVYNDEWKNFGHNRSRSFKYAVNIAKQLGYSLEESYALLLDADMNLVLNPKFKKKSLKADGYQIIQKNSDLTYYNTRLIKLSGEWQCVGVTHEYWRCCSLKEAIIEKINENMLMIDDRNDGGCKADKFPRDIRLLTQGIKDEPNNERYYFYLANSYKDSGDYSKAIEWYHKRIEKGGWAEEVFYSIYRIGECYSALGENEKSIFWFLKAHNYRPSRGEAIYEVAHKYRNLGEHQLAYLFAKTGREIPYPKNDLLFIRHSIYNYLFLFEISIVAFYLNDKCKLLEGYECCKKLIEMKDIPQNIRNLTLSNIKFYEDKISGEKRKNK